jgi:hypothetical protein
MRLCSPHSLQHLLDLAFGLRELRCIAGAQHHIRVGPVLEIEERIAPDRELQNAPEAGPLASREACKRGDVQKKGEVPDPWGQRRRAPARAASALLLGTPDRR